MKLISLRTSYFVLCREPVPHSGADALQKQLLLKAAAAAGKNPKAKADGMFAAGRRDKKRAR